MLGRFPAARVAARAAETTFATETPAASAESAPVAVAVTGAGPVEGDWRGAARSRRGAKGKPVELDGRPDHATPGSPAECAAATAPPAAATAVATTRTAGTARTRGVASGVVDLGRSPGGHNRGHGCEELRRHRVEAAQKRPRRPPAHRKRPT